MLLDRLINMLYNYYLLIKRLYKFEENERNNTRKGNGKPPPNEHFFKTKKVSMNVIF